MSESANTRKMRALVLRCVAQKGQKAFVERLQTTPTRVSRFFSDEGPLHFNEILAAIDEMELKLVGADVEVIDREKKKALAVLAMEEVRRMSEE